MKMKAQLQKKKCYASPAPTHPHTNINFDCLKSTMPVVITSQIDKYTQQHNLQTLFNLATSSQTKQSMYSTLKRNPVEHCDH